jgi:hypothetical protein
VDVEDPRSEDVRETSQWDDADDNPRPDDGWQAKVFNSSDQELHATVVVTCG